MELSLEIAKQIWSYEDGYKRINNYFCKKDKTEKKSTYLQYIKGDDNKVDYNDKNGNKIVYDVENVIKVLKSGMKTSRSTKKYYRGEGVKSKNNYKKEGFISLSEEMGHAIPFMENGCCLFEVEIDDDVKILNTGVEKEILVEDGCYWEYTGKSKKKVSEYEEYNVLLVKIHSPSNINYKSYPLFSECLISKKIEKIEKNIVEDYEDEEMKEFMKGYNPKGGKKLKTKRRKTIKKKSRKRNV